MLSILLTDSVAAEQDMQADMNRLHELLQEQESLMKPELQMKVKALSPESKKILLNVNGIMGKASVLVSEMATGCAECHMIS